MLQTKKNNIIQFFRAVAIIAVVMIHTTPPGNYQVICRPFINFSVATFLFLSGYLTKINNNNWIRLINKRITRVIIPYFIWTILYTIASQDISEITYNIFTARAAAPLYYIFVYIQFVLLTPLLCLLAQSKYRSLGLFVSPISILIYRYYWYYVYGDTYFYVSLVWSDSCLGWFLFYYLGILLGNGIYKKIYSIKWLLVLYVISIVFQMCEGYLWKMFGDVNCGTQLKLTSLITSTIFLLIVHTLLRDNRFVIKSKFLIILGDYSFGIYLCHIMIMMFLSDYVSLYKNIPYPINSVIIVLISLCCCYVGNRVLGQRFSRWFGLI